MKVKQYLAIALTLVCAVIGLINIVCAAIFGAVLLTRTGTAWIYFDAEPFRFLWALGFSVICFVGLGALGGLMIWSERQERLFLKRLPSRPRYHDNSRVAVHEPE